MALDFKTLAFVNLMIQFVLLILLFLAVSKARNGIFSSHCTILKITVTVQLAAIFIFMLPQFPGYKISNGSLIDSVKILHHILGSLLIVLWIYMNLVYSGYIRWPENFRVIMRGAFAFWITAFFIGVYIYINLYYW